MYDSEEALEPPLRSLEYRSEEERLVLVSVASEGRNFGWSLITGWELIVGIEKEPQFSFKRSKYKR